MKIEKLRNKIVVYNPTDFNVAQTLECGQIFRYQINNKCAYVYCLDKSAKLTTYSDRIEIETKDVDFFYNFFDFETDYSKIKKKLKNDEFLSKAIEFGYGIRILNNDLYEMLISFIISANNNIKRIQKSIQSLCVKFGKNKGEFYAFPTLSELKMATVEDFKQAGLGYRAEQMFKTVQKLTEQDLINLKKMNSIDQEKFLISLSGIGEKVANCIMLFGLAVRNVFPVDTWINKVYNDLTKTNETNRKKITKKLTNRYGELSGYAQQYVYYYYRENK